MNIYFLISFFLPITERTNMPEPSRSMAAGSGRVIMMPSKFMKPATASPVIRNKAQIVKRSTAIIFFIDIVSFPLRSWVFD